MIAATCGGDSDLIELPDTQKKSVAELASRFSLPVLVQDVGICQSLAYGLRGSRVARAMLEAAMVRLAEAEKFVDPQSLIERLETLTGGGEKKKLTTSDFAERGPRDSSELHPLDAVGGLERGDMDTDGPGRTIRWEASWLKGNWSAVIDALFAIRQATVGGCLRAGQVMGFEDDVLTLGFDARHETLLRRCSGPMKDAIHTALRTLTGREIRCRYISTGQYSSENDIPASHELPLSTEEKRQIRKDPTVTQVLELFGGEVVDIRRRPAPQPAENGEEENND